MKKQTMYLDITKKVGDQSAVKTSDQLIKELEAKLAECLKVDSSIAAIAKMVNPRIEELEAQLQVAVEALERARNGGWGLLDHWDNAKSALLKIRE